MKNNSIISRCTLFLVFFFLFTAKDILCNDLFVPQSLFEEDPPECSSVKASFEMEGHTGCSPLTVQFLNTSQDYVSFVYDFGDEITLTGTFEESSQLVHTFNNPSMYRDTTYFVTLRVSSADGCHDEMTQEVVVMSSPIANFLPVSPYPADYLYPAPPIVFENLIPLPDRDHLQYLWSHTDACTESNDVNIFSNNINPSPLNISNWGKYNITQHVTSPNGLCFDSKMLTIKIVPPTGDYFIEDIPAGSAPYEVTFICPLSLAASYKWDFGDGHTSNEKNPTHVYTDAGEYWVTLTVMGADLCGVSNGYPATFFKSVLVHPNALTGNGEISQSNPLKAWVRNEQLHITGLTKGKMLSIYTVTGSLVHQSIVKSNEMNLPLSVQGVYIIRSGINTVKVAVGN